MELSWIDADLDTPPDPLDAQEIESAIANASHLPISGLDGGEPKAAMPAGWDTEESWCGPVSGENPTPSGLGQNLSEEEAAALLVDLMSKSAVYVEDGKLQVEPDPAEVERWNDQKGQDVRDIIGQVTAEPENVRLIADALESENARLEELMAEHEEAVAQAGHDEEAPDVLALAQEIQDLHTRIQDLTEQYISLAGLPVPGTRGPYPRM